MPRKLTVETWVDESGRPTRIFYKGKKVSFNYDDRQALASIDFEGVTPTLGDIAEIVSAVGTKNIDTIAKLEEITKLKDAVSIGNAACIVNPDFEEEEKGWQLTGGAVVTNEVFKYGTHSLKCPNGAKGYQIISPSIRVADIVDLSVLRKTDVVGGVRGQIILYYSDATTSTTNITPISTSWAKTGLTPTAGKYLVGIELIGAAGAGNNFYFDGVSLTTIQGIRIEATDLVTLYVDIAAVSFGNLPIDITAQTIGNLTIDIAAQTIGNLAVSINAQTVDLDIKTSGGTNIIIDKLTQSAYTGRSNTTLANDNGVTAPTAPPLNFNGTYRGKFFPRGCRGILRDLYIYCKRTGAGTLTLSFSPQPGMGPIDSVTITPGADWGWASQGYNKFWNYDSLFMWISAVSADVSVGYQAAAEYDWFKSDDSGVTWYRENNRLFVRAVLDGSTIGDVPVSGTINNIEIPNASSASDTVALNLAGVGETLDTAKIGSGKTLIVIFGCQDDDDILHLRPRLKVDGANVMPLDVTFNAWQLQLVNTSNEGIAIGVWDITGHNYSLIVTLRIPFKRKLEVGFYNDEAVAHNGFIGYSWETIS